MKNRIFILLSFGLLSSALIFSNESEADQRVEDAKNALISNHVEFVRASIDQKCQNLKKKIRKTEDQLHRVNRCQDDENGSNMIGFERQRKELTDKIKKHEDKLEALKAVKLSLEIIDFQSL